MAKEMRGIKYLRTVLLNLTGEQFGEIVDASKHTVAKWESGINKIPERVKTILAEKFGCNSELLERVITETERIQMERDHYIYSHKDEVESQEFRAQMNVWSEQQTESFNGEIERISDAIAEDVTNLDFINRVISINDKEKGAAILNIILTAAEMYQNDGGASINFLAIGSTDYGKGRIKRNDQVLQIIRSALSLALDKK